MKTKKTHIQLNTDIMNIIENFIQKEYSYETPTIISNIIEKTSALYYRLMMARDDENIIDIEKTILKPYKIKTKGGDYTYKFFIDILIKLKLLKIYNKQYISKKIIKNPILKDYIYIDGIKYIDKKIRNIEYIYDKENDILTRKPKNILYQIFMNDYTIFDEMNDISINEKLLYSNIQLKTEDEWLFEYSNKPNIQHQIKSTYKLYYDIDEVKQYLIKKRNTIDEKGRIINDKRILLYLYKARIFNERRYNFIISNEGRLYSPISQQPKMIRHLLKMNDEYLYDIDIRNSQPLLLSTYIKNPIYKEDVEDGIFYDKLLMNINEQRLKRNKTINGKKPISRDILKERVYSNILFNEKPYNENSQLYMAINDVYGDFNGLSIIDELSILKKEKGYIWRILQKMESDIFINKLYEKLKNYDISYVTIHDSILIKKENIDIIIKIINELYYNIDIKPTMNIEYKGDKIKN